MTTGRQLSARLPGTVRSVAAWDASSPILTTGVEGNDLDTTVVGAVDLNAKVLWHRRFKGKPTKPRLTRDRTVWIVHSGPQCPELTLLDVTGKIVDTCTPQCDPSEVLGSFVVLPDGFIALWLPAGQGHAAPPWLPSKWDRLRRWFPTKRARAAPGYRHARLARHDLDGRAKWSTVLPLRDIAFRGCVYIGRGTGGKILQTPPWTPRIVEAGGPTALLVSGSRVAATVRCGDSGIAVTFFVDTDTGRLIGKTAPGPTHLQAIAGPGTFLIGSQGYGVFITRRYDAAGVSTEEWPTHAQMLINPRGVISGPESQNTSGAQYFVCFGTDGDVHRGPKLSGYHTAYPALDNNGAAVFWRDGWLQTVTANLRMRRLLELRTELMGRVLLLEDGHIVVDLAGELVIVRDPQLGPLSDGIWPCADGGLQGNPVIV